jgi:hypothetical protein
MTWTLRGDLLAVGIAINWRRWKARQEGLELVGIRLGPLHYRAYCEQRGVRPPLPEGYGHGKPPVPVLLDTSISGIAPITQPLDPQPGRPRSSRDHSTPDSPQA